MRGDIISIATVVILALVPGMPFSAWIARKLEFDGWGWLAVSAAVSTAAMVPPYLLGQITPLSLRALLVIWAITLIGLGAWRFRDLRHVRGFTWPLLESGVVVLTIVLAFITSPWFSRNVDTFYHLAAVRSLIANNASFVVDPLYGTTAGGMDPSSGLFHTLIATWSLLKQADPLFLLPGVMLVSAFVIITAVMTLVRSLTGKTPWVAVAGVLYIVVVLFGDFRSMAYSSTFSTGIAFIGIAGLVEYVCSHRREGLWLFGFSSAAVASTHLGSAQLMLVVGAAMTFGATVVQRPGKRQWHRAGLTVLVVALCMAPGLVGRVAAIASHSAIFVVTPAGDGDQAAEAPSTTPPGAVVRVPGGAVAVPRNFHELGTGPFLLSGLLALALLFSAWRQRDSYLAAGATAAVVPALLALTPPLAAFWIDAAYYVGLRLLLTLDIVGLVAVILAFASRGGTRVPLVTRLLAGLTLAAMLIASYPLVVTVYGPRPDVRNLRIGQANESIWRTKSNSVVTAERLQAIGWMRSVFADEYPTVIARPQDGYELAGLMPVTLVAAPDGHSPLAVEYREGPARRDAAEEFFRAHTPIARRRKIADEWGAQYAFMWIDSPESAELAKTLDGEHGLFEVMVRTSSARLYRIRGN